HVVADMWWATHAASSAWYQEIAQRVARLAPLERDLITSLVHWHPKDRIHGHTLLMHPLFATLRVPHFAPSAPKGNGAEGAQRPEHIRFYEAHERAWPRGHVPLDQDTPLAQMLRDVERGFEALRGDPPPMTTVAELQTYLTALES